MSWAPESPGAPPLCVEGLLLTPGSMQAFLRLSESVGHESPLENVLEAALDCVESGLGFTRASVLLFDGRPTMRFRAWRGISEAYRRAVDGHSPWTAETPDAQAYAIEDVARSSDLGDDRAAVLAEGIRALAFVPLEARGRLLGKLVLYDSAPHAFSREELGGAQAVAGLIAQAIEHRSAGLRLEQLNAMMSAMIDQLPVGLAFVDAAGRVRLINRALGAMSDIVPGEFTDRPVAEALELAADRIHDHAALAGWVTGLIERRPLPSTREVRTHSGRLLHVHYVQVHSRLGALHGHLWHVTDETARRQLESQLLHAQKMEGLGRLAGGVAHDFNNLLTAVIGYLDLLALNAAPSSEESGFVRQALEAADQAADLTRQLLTFARRQPVQLVPQNLNALIERMAPLLRRLMPANVDILTQLAGTPCWTRADAGQLEQVLVNLVFNARDAMPEGGRLLLATLREAGGVRLVVEDSGVGMDAETRAQVFEPFFTTKDVGRGSGLGLATVYGVVQQCGGNVSVESEPGRGARFTVWLPAAEPPAGEGPAPVEAVAPRGAETVLVVEDDPAVRGLMGAMLARLGYDVLAAGDARGALEVAEAHAGPLHLLLTDIVMPGMSGRALARRLKAVRPELCVLLMSGNALPGPAGEPGAMLMAKPFSMELVARRVREALDAGASRSVARARES